MTVRPHPLTQEFFKAVERFGLSIPKFSIAADMNPQTFYNWRRCLSNPTVQTMDRALHVIGYELRICKRGEE